MKFSNFVPSYLSFKMPLGWTFAIALCFLVGCEDIPQNLDLLAEGDSAWVANKRGGYDWNYSRDFLVNRPTAFTFFADLDREKIAANWRRQTYSEPVEPHRPEGMDDDTYMYYRRLTEPHWDEPPLLEIACQGELVAMDLDRSGRTVLVVSEKLEVWDIGKQAHTLSVELPMADVRQAFLDVSKSLALLVSPEQVVVVGVADGAVMHRWRPTSGEILAADYKESAGVLAVATSTGDVVALLADLQQIARWGFGPASKVGVEVGMEGEYIFYSGPERGVTLEIESGVLRSVLIDVGAAVQDPEAESIMFAAVPDSMYLYSDQVLYSKKPMLNAGSEPDCVVTSKVHFLSSGWVDDGHWATFVASQRTDEGVDVFVQDASLDSNEQSARLDLPRGVPKLFATDQLTEVLALGYEDSVEMISRRRWVDLSGNWTAQKITLLLDRGKIDQVELFINSLGEKPVLRNGVTGAEVRTWCISHVAQWYMDGGPMTASVKVQQKLDEWHEADSLNSILVRCRERDVEFWRVGLNPQEVAENRADVERLQSLAPDSQFGYRLQLQHKRNSGESYLSTQDILPKCLERFPGAVRIQGDICVWIGENRNLGTGLAHSYLDSLLQAFPEDARDLYYAAVVLEIATNWNRRIPGNFGFDIERLGRGMEQFVENRVVRPEFMKVILGFAKEQKRNDLVQKATAYQQQHYLILSGVYGSDAVRKATIESLIP